MTAHRTIDGVGDVGWLAANLLPESKATKANAVAASSATSESAIVSPHRGGRDEARVAVLIF